jgi:serine/threonine-protein kinase
MKVLLPDLVGRQDLAARFLREIKLLAALDHPNIAALRTALTADNQLVMIMEFVEGQTLAQRLQHGPIPVADAVNYVGQALDALRYAHAQHIVHRDIKPANMMLTPAGVIKVTDFGIARQRDDQTITVAGATTGSLSYMSPEQINGETTDARSDLYSLGISLYEMVTGQCPFRADNTFAVMVAHLKETPRPPIELLPSLGPELNEIILTSIAKDPAERFQTAEAFRNALARLQPSIPGVLAAARQDEVGTRTHTALATPIPAPVQSRRSDVKTPVPPVVPPPAASTTHPGLYMALGGLLLLIALIGTGLYMGLAEADPSSATKAAAPSAPPTPSAEASPASSPSAPPADVTTPPSAEAPTSPAPPAVETAASSPPAAPTPAEPPAAAAPERSIPKPPMPSANARTTKPAAAAPGTPSQPVETISEAEASAPGARSEAPAQPAVDFDQLEDDVDQLLLRAAVVNRSLDALEQAQARQGLGLRGETALRREQMNLNLTRAREAIDQRNAGRAEKFSALARSDVEALEKFLGR